MPENGKGGGALAMRFKDFAIKETSDEGAGGFTGYAATFDREPDSYGDVIAKGAFADTLKAWAESGRPVPLLYGHNMEDPDYNIGTAELTEDDKGLLAKASFDSTPKAQRVRELVREGRLGKMSFAFDVVDEAPVELDDGTKANELRKLELYEVSVVLVPANSHAEIIEAKARAKYGATISKATGEELKSALDEIEAIGESAKDIAEAAEKAASAISALLPAEDEGETETVQPADEGGGEEDLDGDNSPAKLGALANRLKTLLSE